MKKTFLLIVFFGIAILLNCSYSESASQNDSAVLVEYNQYRVGPHDNISFTFLKKGTYEISFAIPPKGKGRNDERFLPQNFTLVVTKVPHKKIIEQPFLPDFLKVTITNNGESSSHVYW